MLSRDECKSFSDLVQMYLWWAENVRKFSESSLKSRRIYLRDFDTYLTSTGKTNFREIDAIDVDVYHALMAQRTTRRGGKPISIGTINTSIRCVKSVLNWATTYLGIKLVIIPSSLREQKVPEKIPDVIVFSQVVDAVSQCANQQDRLIIALMFEAGLRIQEVADMSIEHLKGIKLHVVGKGEKHRITFISTNLADQLRDYADQTDRLQGCLFRPQMHGGLRYEDTDTIRSRIKRVFKQTVDLDMHPHQLRHAFALNLLENGCGLRSIQKLLGHSKIETTMRYLGITDKFLEKDYVTNFGGSVLVGIDIHANVC